ncbi:ThuA domain-containing protein [Marinilongibacter aquaticus]|uniref:ThuA domain-containing protein n=1 Tax=Marinilongibacter aquaticus TaxID=2975157 RepID=UPI0021BD49FA|nr:ThuA domain-containing protein [Marinilongibacter aquaticus]UBM60174.1 ThuA domain-containing protein [Marinilongibacter aquaticus]
MCKKTLLVVLSLLTTLSFGFAQQKKVLVFSKTAGFRHSSIEAGIEFFKKLGQKDNIAFTFSENADDINEKNLKQFNAVVFLNTTGDILNGVQQADFERYIQAGGGLMGIHAAADTEYGWPWYNKLIGGWFASHPGGDVSNVQNGKMTVHIQDHPSTKHLPKTFERKDEFYDFKSFQKDLVNVLITVDEKSYKKGKMGDFHPMAWYHDYDGGKVFYTNFGHVESTFETEADMQKHMEEGLKSVLADHLDYSKSHTKQVPEENRFVKTTLASNLYEPTELAVMPNGKVILVERRGGVKVWLPESKTFKTINQMPVFSTYEYGLMGIGLDPDFAKNNYVYLYYTPNTDVKENYLSRFVYDQEKDQLDLSSEVVVLTVGIKKNECCHTGGSIDWDSKGNLYLSTGDDTNPFASDGFGPMDFQEGRQGWDALRSSGNTNDLRGKVLRIKPNPDGTYSIPQGNLYPVGTPHTRPEIFVMGCRNPYRISVDKHTDNLFWGDVGPDAGKPNPERGSEGLVEFNRTNEPGFFGWPMIVGNNRAYNHYDFATHTSGPKYDPAKPINDSPNNTGLKQLPPAQEPLIYYGYGESKEYPTFKAGGCNPMAGPVYYSEDYSDYEHKFPDYFDGKFFAYEWIRDWINLVSFDAEGNVSSVEPFMPSTKLWHPMDMAFAPNGVLYLLEYGPKWNAQNQEAALSVIEFNPGNRPPFVDIQADKTIGAAPLTSHFTDEGTVDYDGDKLTYLWDFDGGAPNSTEKNPTATFNKAGVYNVKLTVTDAQGVSSEKTLELKVGNEVPEVDIAVKGNQSFYLGRGDIQYKVNVKDKEDGRIGKGINPSNVVVSIDYLEGYDKNGVTLGHQQNLTFSNGRRLIEDGDCLSCHQINEKSIGPSYTQIAEKYPNTNANASKLIDKIISGGSGVWGETSMAAHPDLPRADAESMVRYILSINDQKPSLKPAGSYHTNAAQAKKPGAYIIQASYIDKGGDVVGSQTGTSSLALRSPEVPATSYDEAENASTFDVPDVGEVVVANDKGHIVFKDIDLTSIRQIKANVFSREGQTVGGSLVLKVDGAEIGKATVGESQMGAVPIRFKKSLKGKHDLYIEFVNEKAEGKPLFGLGTLDFAQ